MKNEITIPQNSAERYTFKRLYRETLSHALFAAIKEVIPEKRVIIGHSLGDGYYFSCQDGTVITNDECEKIKQKLHSLIEDDTKIEAFTLPYREAIELLQKENLTDAASLVRTNALQTVEFNRIKNYIMLNMHNTFTSLGILKAWELRPYGGKGLLLRYPRSEDLTRIGEWKDNPKLFSVFNEYLTNCRILNLYGIGKLNDIIMSGNIGDFIETSEALQRRKIIEVADMIVKRGTVKCVFVAGPSSSNKTTFAKRLVLNLKSYGYDPIRLSLDDYYFTKDLVPKDENGEPDLECIEAIDTALFKEHIGLLLSGKEVHLPNFEFNVGGTGRRTFAEEATVMRDNTILVVEGLHALNPKISDVFDKNLIFKIYISALTVLNIDEHTRVRTTDNRIIRRLVRDSFSRSAPALETLRMWNSVEKGERKYIFPYQNNVDAAINSAHDYELSVLKVFAEPLLKGVSPCEEDVYPLAQRLLKMLSLFYPIPSTYVPSDSMLREFIPQ